MRGEDFALLRDLGRLLHEPILRSRRRRSFLSLSGGLARARRVHHAPAALRIDPGAGAALATERPRAQLLGDLHFKVAHLPLADRKTLGVFLDLRAPQCLLADDGGRQQLLFDTERDQVLLVQGMQQATTGRRGNPAAAEHVERATGSGQYHGGVIASLIDIAGDYALIAVLGHGVPTINFRVDYLRPATNTDLIAQARVRRAGRTIGVVDIDVIDDDGRLIALGRGCYSTQPG